MKTIKQLLTTTMVLLCSMAANAENERYEYVDLGLPSGTLWATFNVGATQPHESGYYLAWGELEEKVFIIYQHILIMTTYYIIEAIEVFVRQSMMLQQFCGGMNGVCQHMNKQ